MGGQTEQEILHILEEAIKREQAAQNLYNRGAKLANNDEIRGVFELIAAEEVKHESLLRDIYHRYKKQLGLKLLHDEEK